MFTAFVYSNSVIIVLQTCCTNYYLKDHREEKNNLYVKYVLQTTLRPVPRDNGTQANVSYFLHE